jgi:SAM-dependent methyltransferase
MPPGGPDTAFETAHRLSPFGAELTGEPPENRRLSVGCGKRAAEPGLVRLDISPAVNPDVVWDLDKAPYPFEASSFADIECFDVIEHVGNIPKVMEEFHRILRPGGLLRLTTPHFSCANSFIDPTHRWHLSLASFDYFCRHDLDYYSGARFEIVSRRIQFQGGRFSRSIVSRIANRYPAEYEQRFAWIFPAWFLSFELKALKPEIR